MKYARFVNFLPIIIFIVFLLVLNRFNSAFAQNLNCPTTDPCINISDPAERKDCYDPIYNSCLQLRKSLTDEIKLADYRIARTQAQIESTAKNISQLEDEIASLSAKIDRLEIVLTDISNVFLARVVESYKRGVLDAFSLFLSSSGFSDFVKRIEYIRTVKIRDSKLLLTIAEAKIDYGEQKKLREEKKDQLGKLKTQYERQKASLAQEKQNKESLLSTTRNNEERYQQLLADAQREMQQIQQAAAFIFQKGTKTHVNKGDVIGLMGNTGYSFGPHLHFGVYSLKEEDKGKFSFCQNLENPFHYLSSRSLSFNANSCDDVTSAQNKTVGSGSLSWPMSGPTVSQCFGHTPYYYLYPMCGYTHSGIDMYDNSDKVIRAVDDGEAYVCRNCLGDGGNGVFIFHNNGKMTLYWHLQ